MAANESPPTERVEGLRNLSSDQADSPNLAQNQSANQELSPRFTTPGEPPPAARGNDAGASCRNGHDHRVEDARAVRIEDELARRGIALRGGVDRCGPCPRCGGDDRFSINVKDQVFNCRGCGGKGHGAIDLVMFLDGSDFKQAVAALAGAAMAPAAKRLEAKPTQRSTKGIVIARFDYHDAQGAVVYQVERIEFRNPDGSYVLKDGKHEKKFLLRRPDPDRPGEWISGHGCMAGVPRVPYRLPEFAEALSNGALGLVVEGEAKADLLWKWGIPATCNSEGHGSVKNWADHAKYFKAGDQIIVSPDNDQAGRDHANTVGRT